MLHSQALELPGGSVERDWGSLRPQKDVTPPPGPWGCASNTPLVSPSLSLGFRTSRKPSSLDGT